MTWKDAQGVLLRVYKKKKEAKLRKERQEYPKMSFNDICKGIILNLQSDTEEAQNTKPEEEDDA